MSNPSIGFLDQSAEMTSSEMVVYYNNRPLMWRNLGLILLLSFGWGTVFTLVAPLIQLRMNKMSFGEDALETLGTVNYLKRLGLHRPQLWTQCSPALSIQTLRTLDHHDYVT